MARYSNVIKSIAHNAVGAERIQSVSDSPLTTKGDIYTYATGPTRLPVGTNSYALIADSTTTTGLNWAANSDANYYPSAIALSATNNYITLTGAGGMTTVSGNLSTFPSAVAFTTGIVVGGNDAAAGYITINPNTDDTGDYPTTLKVGVNTETQSYTLPLAYPTTSGYALVSTDAGAMSWTAFAGANYYADTVTLSSTNNFLTLGMGGGGTAVSGNLSTFPSKVSFTTGIGIGGNSTASGYIELYEDVDDGDKFIKLQAAAMAGDLTFTLPNAYPASSGYALVSTDAGVMSWAANSDTNHVTTAATFGADGILTGTVGGGGSNWTGDFNAGLHMSSSTANKPHISLTNTTDDNSAPLLDFIKDRDGTAAVSDDLGGIRFYGDDAGGAQHNFARIDVESPVVTAGAEVGSIKFRTTAAGTDNAGVMILSGTNVGIGTITPTGQLHVATSGAASQIVLESRSATENYSTGLSMAVGTARAVRFSEHGSNATYGGYSWEIGSADAGGTEIMRLTSQGNLGIGTTLPSKKIHVEGAIAVSGAEYAGDSGYGHSIYTYNQSGAQTLRIYSDSRNVSGGKRQFIQASARLDINSSEHLGLGTTSSGEYLHLYTAATSNMYIDAGGSFLFRDVDDSSAVRMKLYSATGKLLLNDSSAATKIQLQPSGDSYITNNLGIGTTSPDHELHVSGASDTQAVIDATAAGDEGRAILTLQSADQGFGSIYFGDASDPRAGRITYQHAPTDYDIETMTFSTKDAGGGSSFERMRISMSGAAISTIAPQNGYELTVGGGAYLSGNSTVIGATTLDNGGGYSLYFKNAGSQYGAIDTYGGSLSIEANNEAILSGASGVVLKGTGGIYLMPTGTSAGDTAILRFRELAANGTASISFKGPDSIASAYTMALPDTIGTATQVLTVDSSAAGQMVLDWADAAGTVTGGGTDNYIAHWTSATNVTGTSGFQYDNTDLTLTSATASKPVFNINNTNDDASAGELQFYKSSDSVAVNDNIGKLSFYFDNNHATPQKTLGAKIYSTVQSGSDGAEGGYLYFSTMKAGTEVVTMTLKSGNVGFGTNSPGYQYSFSKRAGADTNMLFEGNNTSWLIQNVSSDGTYRFKNNNDAVNVMTLASGGNVGIGTTSPSHPLSVYGSLTDWVAELHQTNTTAGQSWGVQVVGGTNASDCAFEVKSVGGTVYQYVRGDGNVGIGTTAPTSKLMIIDTSNPDGTGDDAGSVIIRGQRDGTANLLTLQALDNNSPTDPLPNGQGGILRFQGFDGTDQENMGFIGCQADGQAVANGDAPSRLILGTSPDASSVPVTRMTIDSSGYVGIGTTSPAAYLDVVASDLSALFGSDEGANATLTNSTQKTARIGMPHYTNAEEPVGLIVGVSNATQNILQYGGGSSSFNAASVHKFYTSDGGFNTTNGTVRASIEGDANYDKLFLGSDSTLGFYRYSNRMDFYISSNPRLHLDASKLYSETSGGPLLDLSPTVNEANYGFVDDPDTGMSRTAANTLVLMTAATAAMTIDSSQNVVFAGTISATAKSFNIPHPLYKDKRLVHGSLEGPEHGLYIRGTIEAIEGCLIELPEYWSAMCEDYTVQLTPHGAYTVFIEEKQMDKIMVGCTEKNFKFDYYIVGARTDETIEVVQDG